MENFYPESPQQVPAGFTQPCGSYKMQVVYVLFAMFIFLCLYLALLYAAGWLVYLAITYPMDTINKFTILLKLGSIAMSGMLFGFLLKFLTKKHDNGSPLNVEVTEKEHPRLFAFIKQLCAETNAPLPNKVFVNHEINACVFYDSTILSLFLPVRKNLLIGLGLVNSLNMSEFKAVVAHEFGHFSQSSMKLGSYVYMANQIIISMIYERDKWDELLETWKRSDLRLAVFAWMLMPVVWLIRKLMVFIYQGINLVNASLSRQMEFNADRVAVSVAGSDAIVNALYRLGISGEAFNFSNNYLSTAVDNKLYTSNLFYHHNKAIEHLSRNYKDFRESLLENRNATEAEKQLVFSDDDAHLAEMYSSHPSNYKREQNAKAVYIAGVEDKRSPWLLFSNPEALAEQVTCNLLRVNLDLHPNITFTSPEEVQSFVEAELTETTYSAQYHGVYNNRLLTDLDLTMPEALAGASAEDPALLQDSYNKLYGEGLQSKMAVIQDRYKDLQTLNLIMQKQDKRKEFSLTNGFTYESFEAEALIEQRLEEFKEDERWYEEFDRKVFAVHYSFTADKPEQREAFLQRYRFQMAWLQLFKQLQQEQERVQETIKAVLAKGEMAEKEVRNFAASFQQHRTIFESVLAEADMLRIPDLRNINTDRTVREYLLSEALVQMSADTIEGHEVNELVRQAAVVSDRMQRIYLKNLGSILSLQETLAESFTLENKLKKACPA